MSNYRDSLVKFVDAVIANDEVAEKNYYSQYIQGKSKEFLGYSEVEEASTITEVVLDAEHGIEMVRKTNDIVLKGKKIGRLSFFKDGKEATDQEDPKNHDAGMYFLGDDGHRMSLDRNDLADVVDYVKFKYLGIKK